MINLPPALTKFTRSVFWLAVRLLLSQFMPLLCMLRSTVSYAPRLAALMFATGIVVKVKAVKFPVGPLGVVGYGPPFSSPLRESITATFPDTAYNGEFKKK